MTRVKKKDSVAKPKLYLAPGFVIDVTHEEEGVTVIDRLSLYEISLSLTHADPHVPPVERGGD